MNRTKRHAPGSLVFDPRRKKWQLFWYESGKRRSKVIGTRQQYPTKASAWLAVEASQPKPKQEALANSAAGPTVGTLVEHYRAEWMPIRFSTSRGYNSWLRNHILPRWGASLITELQARPVELWLRSLTGLCLLYTSPSPRD